MTYSQPQFPEGIVVGRLIVKPRRLQAADGPTIAIFLFPYATWGLGRIRAGALMKFGTTLMWKSSCVE